MPGMPAPTLVDTSGAMRIAWFHSPKCGTSFGTTLIHYANSSLPAGVAINSAPSNPDCMPMAQRNIFGISFMCDYPFDQWFNDRGAIFWEKPGGRFGGKANFADHTSISELLYARWSGHFVGLFRNPALRAESAYNYFGAREHYSREAYARRIRGSQTSMLTGQTRDGLDCFIPSTACLSTCTPGRNSSAMSAPQLPVHYGSLQSLLQRLDASHLGCAPQPNIEKALARLHDGFAFVGITEMYDLSVCLFHAMFGGACHPSEFSNVRLGRSHGALLPTAAFTAWGGLVDGDDWTVYAAALQIFFRQLRSFHVNEETCAALCPLNADRFGQYAQLFRRLRL